MRTILSISLVTLAAILLLTSNRFLVNFQIPFHSDPFINKLFNFQTFGLILAFTVLGLTLFFSKESVALLSIGDLTIIAEKSKWLGINGKTTWLKNGLQLLIFISLGTGIFMFLGLQYTKSTNNFSLGFMPYVILFSLSNSFLEEIIFRFGIIGNLQASMTKASILLVSAILFGLPHYFGNPSGPVGVLMSAALGFILAKATYETQGLGIAWAIHFVQDVVIFTSLFMMNAK